MSFSSFHFWISFGSQLRSSLGALCHINSSGLVYCGYSFLPFRLALYDSSMSDLSLITQGSSLTIPSISTIEANSQLVRTYFQIEISSIWKISFNLSSIHS
ncbi:TPA: hypothetical protein DCZ31_03265 [Patescibacteria group bacterium]|nr:hypothetical protein [Candidatus Gracilibacteria bacterium]